MQFLIGSCFFRNSRWAKNTNRSAFTLMEVMVAVGLMGILGILLNEVYVQEAKNKRRLDDKIGEIEVIRRILLSLDCEATKVTNCAHGPYIALRSASPSNPVLVRVYDPTNATDSTKIGPYYVRALCHPDHKISIEVQDSRAPTGAWKKLTQKVPMGCYMP